MSRFARGLLALFLALVATPALAEPSFPKLTGRVVDAANLLDPAQEAAMAARLQAIETQTGHQLVVATIADLQDYDIADYGYQLGRAWGLGDKAKNDGALLIVAPKERRTRIEVGYGLEPVLTDAMSNTIIQQAIIPRFKANDYPGGIAAGVEAIATQIALPPEEAAARAQAAAQAARERRSRGGGIDIGTLIFWGLAFVFVVLPMLIGGARGRRYRRSGIGEAILWTAINIAANSRGGGGSDWGGGGGGGGGFSGGGGSFGGGGASGGW